jgi:6-phosphogluconolactonase
MGVLDTMASGTRSRSGFSRREFLKASSATVLGFSTYRSAARFALTSDSGKALAYVGTDTGRVDGAANSQGIYLFEVQPRTGELSLLKLAAKAASPSWICLHPSKRHLYSVNEVSDYQGNSGSVSAFSIDRISGDLQFLNVVSSHGAGPAHMSLDATGKYAFVANYNGGSIAVLSIQPDGSLGEAVYVHEDQAAVGAMHATDAPPGSFAISGHDNPHAHMIQVDPTNRFVLQTDLGQDRIYVYNFDSGSGKLTPANIPSVSLPSGDGPRHFAFHPNSRWLYSIQEEASTLAFFRYDPSDGSLTPQQTISTLPSGFTGTNFCSEVVVSRDGRFLYAANRLHNSVAVFGIATNGILRRIGETLTEGDYPSHIALDSTGEHMYVCNQRSDQITSFHVNRDTGALTFTGQYQPLGAPMCMVFLT